MNYNCSNLLDLRNLKEQIKKAFCYKKLFCPSTVPRNCSSGLKILQILGLQPQISKKNTLEHYFLKVGQNNIGNKIPFSNICDTLKKLQKGAATRIKDDFIYFQGGKID